MSDELEFQHRSTKKFARLLVYSQKDQDNMIRWIEIALEKHGWYKI